MHGKLKGSELAVKGDRAIALCGVFSTNATDDPDKVTCISCRDIIYKNASEIHKWMGKRSTKPVKLYRDPYLEV
jgi:hypothetical protein